MRVHPSLLPRPRVLASLTASIFGQIHGDDFYSGRILGGGFVGHWEGFAKEAQLSIEPLTSFQTSRSHFFLCEKFQRVAFGYSVEAINLDAALKACLYL